MRTIEIDLELHRLIEAARTSFEQPEREILKNLLGSPAQKTELSYKGEGVELPHSTECRAEYNGQRISGEIRDGKWLVAGRAYNGPSPALQENVVTKSGKKTNLNGWVYWYVKLPGSREWKSLNAMRSESRPSIDLDTLEIEI